MLKGEERGKVVSKISTCDRSGPVYYKE